MKFVFYLFLQLLNDFYHCSYRITYSFLHKDVHMLKPVGFLKWYLVVKSMNV